MILWHVGTTLVVLWFTFRGNRRLDYRIAAAGSVLPDVIDYAISRGPVRSYAHALLLNVAVFAVLFFLRGRRKRAIVLLPIGALLHLAEEAMWSDPRVFGWPVFGAMPHHRLPWITPLGVAGEVVGAILIVWLLAAHEMLSRDGIRDFLRTGHLEKD